MQRFFSVARFSILAVCCATLLFCCAPDKPKAPAGQISATVVSNPFTAGGIDSSTLKGMPVLSFSDTTYDFGTLKEGDVVVHKFTFTNSGRSPLVISGASGSCGCTVGDYPKGAIAPGTGGEITVTFNSGGKNGHQEKSIDISSNSAGGHKLLFITADVAEQ